MLNPFESVIEDTFALVASPLSGVTVTEALVDGHGRHPNERRREELN